MCKAAASRGGVTRAGCKGPASLVAAVGAVAGRPLGAASASAAIHTSAASGSAAASLDAAACEAAVAPLTASAADAAGEAPAARAPAASKRGGLHGSCRCRPGVSANRPRSTLLPLPLMLSNVELLLPLLLLPAKNAGGVPSASAIGLLRSAPSATAAAGPAGPLEPTALVVATDEWDTAASAGLVAAAEGSASMLAACSLKAAFSGEACPFRSKAPMLALTGVRARASTVLSRNEDDDEDGGAGEESAAMESGAGTGATVAVKEEAGAALAKEAANDGVGAGAAPSNRRKLALPKPAVGPDTPDAGGAGAGAGIGAHGPVCQPNAEAELAELLRLPIAASALANTFALPLLLKAPPPAPPADTLVALLTSPNGMRCTAPEASLLLPMPMPLLAVAGPASDALPRLPKRSRRIAAEDLRPLPGVFGAAGIEAGGPLDSVAASLWPRLKLEPVTEAKCAALFSGSTK